MQTREICWKEWGRLQIIALADIPIQLNAPKLNDKEKTAIKEKFRKFNSTFEELITTNRYGSIVKISLIRTFDTIFSL